MANLKYIISVDDQTKKGILSSQNNLKNLSKGLDDASKSGIKGFSTLSTAIKGGIVVALALATKAVIDFGKESVQAFRTNEPILLRLQASAKSAGASYSGLNQYISAIARTTLATGTEISNLTAKFLQLGRSESEVKKLLETAVLLSNATGQTLDGAMNQLAKTLGGTAGELAELIPELKTLTTEQLRSGEALNVVNGQLAEYKGLLDNTSAQTMKNFADSMDNLKTIFGEVITNALNPLITKTTEWVDKIVEGIKKAQEANKLRGELISGDLSVGSSVDELTSQIDFIEGELSRLRRVWQGELATGAGAMDATPTSLMIGELEETLNTLNNALDSTRQAEERRVNIANQLAEAENRRTTAEQSSVDRWGSTFTDWNKAIQDSFSQSQRQQQIRQELGSRGITDENAISAEWIRQGLSGAEIKISDKDFQRLQANQGTLNLGQIKDYFLDLQYLNSAMLAQQEEQRKILEEQLKIEQEQLNRTNNSVSGVTSLIESLEKNLFNSSASGSEMMISNFNNRSDISQVRETLLLLEDVLSENQKWFLEEYLKVQEEAFQKELNKQENREGKNGGFNQFIQGVADVAGGLLDSFLGLIKSIEPLNAILNWQATLLQGVMDVIAPLVEQVLVPFVGVITVLGQMIGELLVPVFEALYSLLEPLLELLGMIFTTLLQPLFQILSALIGAILQPLFEALGGIFTIIETLLTPVLALLFAILQPVIGILQLLINVALAPLVAIVKALSAVFVWLYNRVFRVIGNLMLKVFGNVANFFVRIINGVISLLNKIPFVNIRKVQEIDVAGSQLKEIKTDDSNTSQFYTAGSSSSYNGMVAGGSGGSGATYSGTKDTIINITVNTSALVGGVDEFALMIRNIIERKTALGY